jgi:hypothetical protein
VVRMSVRLRGGGMSVAAIIRTVRLTAAESFWYTLGCVWFGAMYLAKVPAKKALCEAGLAQMTSAERCWYVVQCFALGAGYLLKVPLKKALSEVAYGPGPDSGLVPPDDGWLARPVRAWGHQPRPRHSRQAAQHGRQAAQHGLHRAQLRPLPPVLPVPRQAGRDDRDRQAW